MRNLQVFIFACVALLKLRQVTGVPVVYSRQLPQPVLDCRIEIMNEVDHKTFYEYCSSFEGSEINIPRNSVYFTKNEKYAEIEEIVEDYFEVVNKTSVSPECLVLIQPFICFYYFKFPISDNCADGYLPPCTDLCQRTHNDCMKDFESMVKKGIANPKDLEHLDCINFKETSNCITFTPSIPTEAAATDDLKTEVPETDPVATYPPPNETSKIDTEETHVPVECNCSKKVRKM